MATYGRPARSTLFLLLSLGFAQLATAELDLRNAAVERLDNGLTVILLEDRNFPVVSVQMLYRVGARNESTGRTGIAHFVEHLAFRASENFPDTGLVSSIYAVGGEWHGYTWTDETTYFATVPAGHLDLLLRIEADRMTRLTIGADVIEAERGAVLAEMHQYENSPTSMLVDNLLFTSFLAHPYRNNTIGFESDIEKLTHADVVEFYQQHYHPANAVLAVVGDFEQRAARDRIGELFGGFPRKPATPPPHTKEPPQDGVRQIRIGGRGDATQFMIGYRAPSSRHPDFAAFLVLQELLGGGSGVSFLQNDWGTPVAAGSRLAGTTGDLTTWYPPSAQDYIFAIGGTRLPGESERDTLAAIEAQIASARQTPATSDALDRAIARVLTELTFDVETTEDAAHQLAFFEGLGALDVLLSLPASIAAVTQAQVLAAANAWLQPQQRTIAWYAPPDNDREPASATPASAPPPPGNPAPPDLAPLPPPVITRLGGGTTLIVQRSDLSRSGFLQVVVPGDNVQANDVATGSPVSGYSSFSYRFEPAALTSTVVRAKDALASAQYAGDPAIASSTDPDQMLERNFRELMADHRASGPLAPALIVVSGDVDPAAATDLVARHFDDLQFAQPAVKTAPSIDSGEEFIHVGSPVAQSTLGYIVAAPGPRDADYAAFRVLLYILSHGYEGRLGVEAISRRGLAYYIGADYRSDGHQGWITLSAGVDNDKIDALQALFGAELQRLQTESPTDAEWREAVSHLLGRAASAAQSNTELSAKYAEQWLWFGELTDRAALEAQLAGVDREQLQRIARRFADGRMIVVTE